MEKLYNNILLSDIDAPSDAEHVPYLENPPAVVDISVGRQLFVDDFLIEKTELVPEYHKAKKTGQPVLSPETPWEKEGGPCACPKSGGIWYDEKEKKFKMWYEAGWLRHMCYAESEDGLTWVRPDLGIIPGTNLILPYQRREDDVDFSAGDTSYLRPDSTTVFIDDTCPAEERYKLFLRNPGADMPGIAAVSSDGIHFEQFRQTGRLLDRSTVFYNPFRKKWVYSIRSVAVQPDGAGVRTRKYRECDHYLDGAAWTEQDTKEWLSCDSLDQPNPYIGFLPQLYNVDCVGYESIMLGMFQIMYGPENDSCEKYGVPKITDLMPMYSRDGYHFSRPCRKSLIPSSIYEGAWDRGYVQSVGGVCVIHEEELWIYYIGFGGDPEYNSENYDWTLNGMYRNGATGLAKLRRDGFVSMNGTGTLTTRKLIMDGKCGMIVNADGSVSVKILSPEGDVLACSEPFCGDSTGYRLNFPDFDLKTLNQKPFRLEFDVCGKLYSFGFTDASGDCGGAHAAGKLSGKENS